MPIQYEKSGRIATITINRPEALNAIDPTTNAELVAAWADFRDDPEMWVGILTGAGDRAFCAGADLKELIPALTEQARRGELHAFNFGGITRGFQTWKPIIAAINGFALAGGTELALACDIRIASETARFGQPEVRWAIIPGAGGTQRLPRAIGLSAAMEIILTGRQVDAQEALRLGLVHKVVPPGEVMAEALRTAETLLANGPLALRAAKQAVLEGWDMSLEEGLDLELRLLRDLLLTEDAVEGPRAFAEKRTPRYQAR
ncbi:MAG: enoyl-CoA hydratase [Chloroflexota bacterium]